MACVKVPFFAGYQDRETDGLLNSGFVAEALAALGGVDKGVETLAKAIEISEKRCLQILLGGIVST